MESKTHLMRIMKEVRSYFEVVSQMSEKVYLILFALYITVTFILEIAWNETVGYIINPLRYVLISIVMWGAALYLIYTIAAWKDLWKNTVVLIALGVLVLAGTLFFSWKMSKNSYGVVMDLFFCLMVYGKEYKKVLRVLLGIAVASLIIAAIGVPLGFSIDMIKPDNIHPGHSIGIIYPNNWGNLVYYTLMLIWYLYLRHKPVLTLIIFWVVGAFMYIYIYSRTMSIFTIIFPVAAAVIDLIQRREDRRIGENNSRSGILKWSVIAIPFLALVFVIVASMQMEWVHKTFYYTWFHNFAMRFVQGGFYLKTYGMPLFGNPYRSNVSTYIFINGEYLILDNLDSSFVAYIIMRGMFWMTYTLAWLSLANWKALKNRDYAIPFLCTAILLFAMMERAGLEMWYNFILLYPLAKVGEKAVVLPELERTVL